MPDDVIVPAENDDDLEVVLVRDGEDLQPEGDVEPEVKGKVLTDEEYRLLVEKSEAARALATPLEQMIGKMQQAQAVPTPVNAPAPGESTEEFYKRLEEKAFLPGQLGPMLEEFNRRQMTPVIGQFSNIILTQAKQLMRVDPDTGPKFRKYEDEIEREVQAIPFNQRGINVYQDAYQKVLVRHQGDLVEEALAGRMEELEAKILEKYGLKKEELEAGAKEKRTPVSSLGGRGSPGPVVKEPKLALYESEKIKMETLGMDPKDPEAVRAYLRNHPRRK